MSTPEAQVRGPSERDGSAEIPADVAAFLTELAQAVQKFGMYPPKHPALGPVAESLLDRLGQLLASRGTLSVGVATRQLIVENAETDPDHTRYTGLAGRLHRHQLAAVFFDQGIDAGELGEFLALVSVEPELSNHPLGFTPPHELPNWRHLRLQPIRYERLGLAKSQRGHGEAGPETDGALVAATGETPAGEPKAHNGDVVADSLGLWRGFARAALVGQDSEILARFGAVQRLDEIEATPEAAREEATVLARALDDFATDGGYAEEILKRLLELSRNLRGADARAVEALRQRASLLVSLVRPDTLRQVLKRGGETEDRIRLLLDASDWMDSAAVVKLVQATAGVEDLDISHWLLLLLSKLASHTKKAAGPARHEAEASLREQIELLVADWSLDDAVPTEYAEALEQLSRRQSAVRRGAGDAAAVEPHRVVIMGLELDELGIVGPPALQTLLEQGQLAELVDILNQMPAGGQTAEEVWRELDSPDTVRRLLEEDPPNFAALDHLIGRLGVEAGEPLLDVLANSPSLSMRRQVFSRLAKLGRGLGRQVVRRLDDRRWYVQRNMLALLGELGPWPSKWSPASFAEHRHPAVRREALKMMLRNPETADMALCHLLEDDDPRNLALGLASAVRGTPPEAIPLLLHVAGDGEQALDLRLGAVRALGARARPAAVAGLLDLVRGRGTWLSRLLGRVALARKTPVMLAALTALARCGAGEPAAAPILRRAERSHDSEIQAALRRGQEESAAS